MRALGLTKTKSKNENTIPNLYPFKKKLIESLERRKKNESNERKAKLLREKEDQPIMDEMTLIESMNRSVVYESKVLEEEKEDGYNSNKQHNKKFYRELNSVLTSSDVKISNISSFILILISRLYWRF